MTIKQQQKAIGATIRSLRRGAKMSLRTFGIKVGKSASLISRIETGKSFVDLKTLIEIASALDCCLHELLTLAK